MSRFIRNRSCEMCGEIQFGLIEMKVGDTKHYLCYPCMAKFTTDVLEFRYYFESFIQCLPKADVVERSKIDKAVEDIEHYKSMLANPYNRKGMERALEIFKRDIGE